MAIRPYSDFEWRADPHAVNATGAPNVMDPGGDYLAAYWLGRMVDLDDASLNITNHPRAPYVDPDAGPSDGGARQADAAAKDASRDAAAANRDARDGMDAGAPRSTSAASCGCDVPGNPDPSSTGALASGSWIALLAARRRLRSRRSL
jgi:hypothetical protein